MGLRVLAGMMSESRRAASSSSTCLWCTAANAWTRVSAPSSSRMLRWTLWAMKFKTSSGIRPPLSPSLEWRIASRVSKSGGWMSAMRPHTNLERNRSSSVGISLGGRSDEMTICLLISCSALKVWKNSSLVRSLPARNCTSSISSTSTVLYLWRNSPMRAVAVEQSVRRAVAGWRDHKIDVDLGAGDRLQCFLDQSREAVLEPILGELARHADPERASVSGDDRCVLEPHVVGAFGKLKTQLFLHLRPDLVLVHPTSSLIAPIHGLWIGPATPVERDRAPSANPVDNLGSTVPSPVAALRSEERRVGRE